MKSLRVILIFALVALLVAGSVGTVYAKNGPPDNKPDKGQKFQGEKQGFSGNVTDVVGGATGNVTLVTEDGWTVTVELTRDTLYKVTKAMNKWSDDYDAFVIALGGSSITALEGMKVVVLAGNVTDTASSFSGTAIKFMALQRPATPQHAHRTGLVIDFNKPASVNGWMGNITIFDIHSVTHTFRVGNSTATAYHPEGMGEGNVTVDQSFVTVVTTGNPKVQPSQPPLIAKAIVLHASLPQDWPRPTP
jgi:hypothetical protein